MNNERLGQRLRAARQRSGLSIDRAAIQSGISASTIFRLEHGSTKCVYLSTLEVLADMYNTSLVDLIGG